ncbi:hypothetical protein GCM10022234_29840 [Aeromicrobium panaciterrae]
MASPAAQAATGGVSVTTSKVAQFAAPDLRTAVPVKCTATATCTGVVRWYNGATVISTPLYYSVAKGTTAYVWTKLNAAYSGSYTIKFAETGPDTGSYTKTMTIEPRKYSTPVGGTISGPVGGITDMKVSRWGFKYGVITRLDSKAIAFNGSTPYSFDVPLGTNNTATIDYRFSISAKVNGVTREWYWRGSPTGTTYSATKTQHHASPVKDVNGHYNFTFGTISGGVSGPGASTAKVRVIGTPAVMPTTQTGRKDLDEPYCGDEYGTATGSSFSIPFIPVSTTSSDPRYIVGVIPDPDVAVPAWNDSKAPDKYGSCLAARNYSDSSTSGLLSFGGGNTLTGVNTTLTTGETVHGVVTFRGFGDRFTDRKLDIRPYVPHGGILNLPIVKRSDVTGVVKVGSDRAGTYSIDKLPPGKYWVSAGRQQSCSFWYPSYYSNNLTYLSGEADRETEIWKSFSRLSYLSGKYYSPDASDNPVPGQIYVDGLEGIAYDHGARYQNGGGLYYGSQAQNGSPGGGYAGWMYRDVCVTEGAGAYKLIDTENPAINGNLLDLKGATISGKVDRDGSKTNKEMMVTAVSTQGILVQRSAYTSSSGSFTIRGLESGNYRIIVNTDSWRGLGRSHSGVQTKRVTRGGSYSVGTLYAHF